MRRLLLSSAFLALVFVACSGDDVSMTDGGLDATADSTTDAKPQPDASGTDSAADSATDSSANDSGGDAATDSSVGDAATDAAADAAADAGQCFDGVQDGNETDVDCGGGTCKACAVNMKCKVNSDCVTNKCKNNVCAP